MVYSATLSAYRFKAFQSVDGGRVGFSEIEFCNKNPHFQRGTLLNDLKQALKAKQICGGWISVLFTKQRSVDLN